MFTANAVYVGTVLHQASYRFSVWNSPHFTYRSRIAVNHAEPVQDVFQILLLIQVQPSIGTISYVIQSPRYSFASSRSFTFKCLFKNSVFLVLHLLENHPLATESSKPNYFKAMSSRRFHTRLDRIEPWQNRLVVPYRSPPLPVFLQKSTHSVHLINFQIMFHCDCHEVSDCWEMHYGSKIDAITLDAILGADFGG